MLFGVKHESENNIINSSLIILGIPMIQKRVAPWGVSWRAFGFFCGDLKLEEGLEKQYIEKEKEERRRQNEEQHFNEILRTIHNHIAGEYSDAIEYKRAISFCLDNNNEQTILVFTPCGLGDYLLYRNFLREIKSTAEYKEAKITLVLSDTLKTIAQQLDGDIVDEFYYLPKGIWNYSLKDQFVFLDGLFRDGLKRFFDTIIYGTNRYTLSNVTLYMQYNVCSKKSIITTGDLETRHVDEWQNNMFYTDVFSAVKPYEQFEFYNNRDYFEWILHKNIVMPMHFIEDEKVPNVEICNKEYIAINVGAEENFRKWHNYNWSKLIRWIKENTKFAVVLIGAKSDANDIEMINKLSGDNNLIVIGEKLINVAGIIKNAKLYIGNDSGCFHLAVSVKTKAICISSGNGYPRFVGYPESNNYKILFGSGIKQYLKERLQKNPYDWRNFVAGVNLVSVDMVKEAAVDLLQNK